MIRLRFGFIFLFVYAVALAAQTQNPALTATADNALTAPEQLRRMSPPEESMSAFELESRADVLRAQKAYADALDYYKAAIRKGENPVLHNKAGITQMQMLRYDEAKKSFSRAIKLDKKYADAHNNLGVIYYIKRNYGKAIKEYKKAIQHREDLASYYSNMGTAYFEKKEFQKASDAYLQALELDPEIFERRATSGVLAHMASPGDRARYHFTIAKMYATKGDADRCLLYLRKAIEEGYVEIGKVYQESEFSTVRQDPRFAALMEQKSLPLPQ